MDKISERSERTKRRTQKIDLEKQKQERKTKRLIEQKNQKQKEIQEMRKQSKSIIKEKFTDFDDFIKFINDEICPVMGEGDGEASHKLPSGTLHMDNFCSNRENFTFEYFTTDAPSGYSLFDIQESIYTGKEYPFYTAIKSIFSELPRLELTERVRIYMIIINRFIYYYQIYLLKKQRKIIPGIDKTAGIIIYTHGAYEVFSPKAILPIEEPLENVFICSKACPGTPAYASNTKVITDTEYKDSSLNVMLNNINNLGYVNFDQSVFRNKYKGKGSGNCYTRECKEFGFGLEMQHYITPLTNSYINKSYEAITEDISIYVIDLEIYNTLVNNPDLTTLEIIDQANIINQESFHKITEEEEDGNFTYLFTLKDIIDYCKNIKQKPNVFIYDTSCGEIDDLRFNPAKTIRSHKVIKSKIHELTGKYGFGISKKKKNHYKKNKTYKKRKTYKRYK